MTTANKTHKCTRPDGRIVRVTVPEDPKPEEMLIDALRENLSPEAVATIIAYLQPLSIDNPKVESEVLWFSELLTRLLGGPEQFNRLAEEVGL